MTVFINRLGETLAHGRGVIQMTGWKLIQGSAKFRNPRRCTATKVEDGAGDTGTSCRIPRRGAPGVLQERLPPRGSRGCRVRAAPAVSRAKLCVKAHTSIQVQRKHSGIPHAMVLRLMPCSPRRRIPLVTVIGGLRVVQARLGRRASADLTPATGAGTTRFCRTRRISTRRLRRTYTSVEALMTTLLRRSSVALASLTGNPPCDRSRD
jgi:hypothetical protein